MISLRRKNMSGLKFEGVTSLALCALVGFAQPARAADEDTQLRLYLNTVVPVATNVTGALELSPRFREGPNQFRTRGTIDFKLSPGASVGGGAAWTEFAGGHEFRSHEQLTLKSGPLAFRTRVEERSFAGADRIQLRLRQRVQLSKPVARNTELAGSVELLYIVRPENRTSSARIDSWRFETEVQHRFSTHVEGALGYLLIYGPRERAPDKISHVPELTLTVRL